MITREPIDGRGGLAARGYAAGAPGMLQRYLNGAVDTLLGGASEVRGDFAHPVREEALVPADSQS
jgi:hypothetical protein